MDVAVITLCCLSWNVRLLQPAAKSAGGPPALSAAAWLAGDWSSVPDEIPAHEEHWSAPAGGSMMGMYRIVTGGKAAMYEFLLLEQEPDGVYLSLRHYRPQLADMDPEPVRLKLTEAGPQKLVFLNPSGAKPKRITYSLESGKDLVVVVETTREGKDVSFTIKMRRTDPS